MSSFTTPLKVEILDRTKAGRVLVRLLEPFSYDVGSEGSGETITVPAGFESDFASVPRVFWRIEPPLGRSGKAAVIHDYLYVKAGMIPAGPFVGGTQKLRFYTRAQADAIFREALGVLGVPPIKRDLMYRAVRIGGGGGWGS